MKEGELGKGYGKKIMKKLINFYDGEIYLSVDTTNKKAISLYKKFSFKEIHKDGSILYMKKDANAACL